MDSNIMWKNAYRIGSKILDLRPDLKWLIWDQKKMIKGFKFWDQNKQWPRGKCYLKHVFEISSD